MSRILSGVIVSFAIFSLGMKPAGGQHFGGGSEEAEAPVTGSVVETMDSGGYTYVLVRSGTQEVWAASDKTDVKVGDELTIPPGLVMRNFESPTLNRKFDNIRFVDSFGGPGRSSPEAGATLPAGHPPISKPMAEGAEQIAVESMEPPAGGLRIAEVHARAKELAGTQVNVRGRVVKYNQNIMGRNWIHIQDGSGQDASDGDMTVTTDRPAAKGDVLTVTGTVAVDQDFGHGYAYDVLIKEAKLTKE
jgi:hypothetical protein